jgi:hypothetical protein
VDNATALAPAATALGTTTAGAAVHTGYLAAYNRLIGPLTTALNAVKVGAWGVRNEGQGTNSEKQLVQIQAPATDACPDQPFSKRSSSFLVNPVSLLAYPSPHFNQQDTLRLFDGQAGNEHLVNLPAI